MAVRKGSRYAPALRAAPAIPQPRRWMVVGAASVLELEGTTSPERSFAVLRDVAATVTRPAVLAVDTAVVIARRAELGADVGIRLIQPNSVQGDCAIYVTKQSSLNADVAAVITGQTSVELDQSQLITRPAGLAAATEQRIYAVLRREDHLILT